MVWNFYWNIITVTCAFIPLMIFHALQYPSLILLPFSRKAFWAYNRPIAYMNWGWWAYALQNLVGAKIEFVGDDVPVAENAIVIANHQSMGDIPVMLCLALKKDRVGDLKWLVKDQLKFMPGIGWGLKFLDALFLKRRWAEDQQTVKETFDRYVSMKTPLWLLLFPEGTRANKKKILSHRAKTTETHYVLPPRSKGFTASVQGLRSVVQAIYDLTIIYPEEYPPRLIELMRGEVPYVHIKVTRFPIDSIPTDEKELAHWLHERYLVKDRVIAEYRKTPHA